MTAANDLNQGCLVEIAQTGSTTEWVEEADGKCCQHFVRH